MPGSKAPNSAAQYLSRSRLIERTSRAKLRDKISSPTEKRPADMLQEPSLRVSQISTDRAHEEMDPRIRDFQDNKSVKSTKANALSTVDAPSADNIQTLANFDATSSPEDEAAPPPPEMKRRDMHVQSRARSSSKKGQKQWKRDPSSSAPTTPERERSSADSIMSYETEASSMPPLPALQTKGPLDESDPLEPVLEDDPKSFELVAPSGAAPNMFSLERRSVQLFSREHLETIFSDPTLLMKFTSYLSQHRQRSIPLLVYHLEALKAIKAIHYANAVSEALEPVDGFDFTEHPVKATVNSELEDQAEQAFMSMVREDLPAYIAHTWTQLVSVSIQKRITGTLAPHLREASEGLAETFCLTDPSRPDNPIVFASEEFHRTTQYGVGYAIGRNCRFLQGPRTDPHAIARISQAVKRGKEHSEIFINYRRDGSPFMNLLMIAPLVDSRGTTRYFIGAQVDVSGLAKDCTDLEGLQRLLKRQSGELQEESPKDEFQKLSEMLNVAELDTVRKTGGRMHREQTNDTEFEAATWHQPRLLIKDFSPDSNIAGNSYMSASPRIGGRLEGVYQNYLLVRPYPSLRILFTSPSLRVPGILQSHFLQRIGGSPRVRDELTQALASGRGVTAKIRWIARPDDVNEDNPGRSRWIHCTPLIGQDGQVGVWMVVLVDDDKDESGMKRRVRQAPPVAPVISGHQRETYSGSGIGNLKQTEYYGRVPRRPSSSRPSTARINGLKGGESPNRAASEQSFAIG